MLCLITRDAVMIDAINHARFKIATILKVDPSEINVKFGRDDPFDEVSKGFLSINFEIDPQHHEGVTAAEAQEVMVGVWNNESKPLLDERMAGLTQRRGYKKSYDGHDD